MSLILALLACDAADSAADSTDSGGEASIAPAEYADGWDTDALSCSEGAIAYWAFEGEIDASSHLTGAETWYWFFPDEGSATDCADTFTLAGDEGESPVPDAPCNSCDRSFTLGYDEDPDRVTCNWDGYENLLDNDETDRIDEESYTMALMLDTDPLGGDPGDVNVWSWIKDDFSPTQWNDRPLATGSFGGDDVAAEGSLKWAIPDGICVTIKSD